jgi:hypothetical protein
VNLPGALTTSGRKFSSKNSRAVRLSPGFTAAAALQTRFHSAAEIVFSPPSVAMLVSRPVVSLGHERRKAARASACLSLAQPAISLNEVGAIAACFSGTIVSPLVHPDRRPAAASKATPPDKTVQRMFGTPSSAFAFSLGQQPVGIARLGVAAERP